MVILLELRTAFNLMQLVAGELFSDCPVGSFSLLTRTARDVLEAIQQEPDDVLYSELPPSIVHAGKQLIVEVQHIIGPHFVCVLAPIDTLGSIAIKIEV